IGECLEEDPEGRPGTARAVLGHLPGADPLDAAVAAGGAPAPGLVGAAGAGGGLGPPAAWSGPAAPPGGLPPLGFLYDYVGLLREGWRPRPPEALTARAQDILAELATSPAADSAFGFDWDRARLEHVVQALLPGPILARARPAPGPLVFF